MRTRAVLSLVVAASVALTGCSAVGEPAPISSSSAAAIAPPHTPTPTSAPQIVISTESVGYANGAATSSADYGDGTAVLALLTNALGPAPTPKPVDGPYGGVWGQDYEWEGITLTLWDSGGSSVAVTKSSPGGIRVVTRDGISIGSTRAEATAAGAWTVYGASPTDLALDKVAAPGTDSLATPGTVGSDYTLLMMDGDTVSQIHSPGNDYSDI